MFPCRSILTLLAAFAITISSARAASEAELQRQFNSSVHPFLQTYCFGCHSKEKHKGDLDLTVYPTMDTVVQDYKRWETVLEKLHDAEMPPEEAKQHPSVAASKQVMDWIKAMRAHEAGRNAGDPGIVLARRLSNAEYDYTIRDLTGVDIRPTREFPVDPANQAGFDNSGESLAMSPALLKKYLDAARYVSDYLVLKPDGFTFAPYPMVADTDRDKYCVNQIIDFYKKQPTDLADYFRAAWYFQNRSLLGKSKATLADFAAQEKVSPKYLSILWSTLSGSQDETGPLAVVQSMWQQLPTPNKGSNLDIRDACVKMRDFTVTFRKMLIPEVKNLMFPGQHPGAQSMVLWKDRAMAANRRKYAGMPAKFRWDATDLSPYALRAIDHPMGEEAQKSFDEDCARFCDVFPDAMYISERSRVYINTEEEKKLGGRLLSAGFHSMMGYFRDDGPLCDMILTVAQQQELDRLWKELDFIAHAPIRQYTGFVWFERTDSTYLKSAEFNFARAEDKDVTSEEKIRRMAEAYLNKALDNGAGAVAAQAIKDYFTNMNATIRDLESAHLAAEPSHLKSLIAFAEKAARRPFSQKERDDLLSFYKMLREKEGATHEEAIRDCVASVLVSPNFSYRIDLVSAGSGVKPLPDFALANRLSYFLWSSMPDAELLAHATAGDLHRPDVLVSQARRMMKDDRIHALAAEFGGNWLDFRRFEEHNAVDRERFKMFDNTLRESMFEEPIRFLTDVVKENRSVLDFLFANRTFVNGPLAKHYGMPAAGLGSNDWMRVDDANVYNRGGLLPMAVFLTKNAPGLRTSPVKRGYWVVKRLLGEEIPPPPPKVPELPADEAKMGELTLRETLERHRSDPSCAGCHQHFDTVGLVFESYGPVGEWRTKDFAGKSIDTHAVFPGGTEGAGLEGLKSYLRAHRQSDFVDNLSRKLLVYALERGLMLSDEPLIETMNSKLASNGYRFQTLIENIITSPQFLNKRGPGDLAIK